MITVENFDGYEKYNLVSDDIELSVITLGATVTALRYKRRDMVLRYESAREYLEGDSYLCATIGRYANRIGGAHFSLNGEEYKLAANEGENQLHGGPNSWDKRRWQAETGDDSLRFTLHSPDGDNGFPGNMLASVTYIIEGSSLRIVFEGESDADTVYAPTSHSYFNLGGSESVLDSALMINADSWLEIGAGLIPTGRLLPCEGDFDFHALRPVERDYDHCFVLNGEHACTMQAGGVRMQLHTDLPALQIYTGRYLGAPHGRNEGLAIEPQFYPDSPNHPNFPSTVLRKGKRLSKYALFCFAEI